EAPRRGAEADGLGGDMRKKARGFTREARVIQVLLGILAACVVAATVRAAELPTIEIGLPDDGLFGLGGQYILDKGLDKKNGFIMKPRWAGVPEIQRLLGIKAISVGLMTPEAGLRANQAGVPIRLVQPYQSSHMYVVVKTDSPYNKVEDLKGK